ncbi:MAG: hypothetical protein QOH61_42 [Chloroflexota bacterium]|jgi:hypothetical protein|nr:hypothetical protein [Chloroflexota bacterium]
MPRIEAVLDIVQALADALERGDDGDMDSPAWETERRLARLQAQLVQLVRTMRQEQLDETLRLAPFEPEFPLAGA